MIIGSCEVKYVPYQKLKTILIFAFVQLCLQTSWLQPCTYVGIIFRQLPYWVLLFSQSYYCTFFLKLNYSDSTSNGHYNYLWEANYNLFAYLISLLLSFSIQVDTMWFYHLELHFATWRFNAYRVNFADLTFFIEL